MIPQVMGFHWESAHRARWHTGRWNCTHCTAFSVVRSMREDKRGNVQGARAVHWSIGLVLAASQNHKVMGWDRDFCVVYMPTKQSIG